MTCSPRQLQHTGCEPSTDPIALFHCRAAPRVLDNFFAAHPGASSCRRKICHKLLQPPVLVPKLHHLPNLIYFQTHVLRIPPAKSLLADPHLADQLPYRHSNLGLLQN